MTTTQFKIKYPQFSQLEGYELWDKVEDILLQLGSVLHADPNQVKVYHEPINTPYGQITMEDSSTTRWLDEDGNLVRVGELEAFFLKKPFTTYKMEAINFNKL